MHDFFRKFPYHCLHMNCKTFGKGGNFLIKCNSSVYFLVRLMVLYHLHVKCDEKKDSDLRKEEGNNCTIFI